MTFPEHKCSLALEHNRHRDFQQTMEKWEEDITSGGCPLGWVSEEQRAKAIAEDSIWMLQWYPETPIGFVRLAACDLDVLLDEACSGRHQP